MFNKTTPQKQDQSSAINNQKKTPARATNTPAPSILGRDITIIGEIRTDGDVQIDGNHEGNVTAATLTIGEQGAINGIIKAKSVLIRGKVTGKINASMVELAETANVQADILQDKLTIANGAFFDGKCSRRKQSATPTATSKATATKK